MSTPSELVAQAYALAKKSDHKRLRPLIHDDATWEPTAKKKWKACSNADEIVRTLLWRAHRANRLRPGEMTELGSFVVFRVHGRRLERLGSRGFWVPKLFQVVQVRDGKIARMRDFGTMEEALAATGHES